VNKGGTTDAHMVVIDLGLVRLVGTLGKSKSSTDRSWTKITEYAAKNRITRKQLRLALASMKGVDAPLSCSTVGPQEGF
jgi:hypothetical protein